MNGLALCAGIGGIDLGLKIACPEYRTVCHIEREAYAAAVLVKRMEEGWLDQAPVWDDLSTFDGRIWSGIVDIIHAGLPCQPYSVAGQQQGDKDERYIWPEFFRILREVQPPLVFLENVPGLLAWFRPVGEELSGMGYEFEAGLFSAGEVGASHQRQRLFILAKSGDNGRGRRGNGSERGSGCTLQTEGRCGSLDDSDSERLQGGWPGTSAFPPGPGDQHEWATILEEAPEVEPGFCGMANGFPSRVDRLRASGNAVVPLTAAWAFITLSRRLE